MCRSNFTLPSLTPILFLHLRLVLNVSDFWIYEGSEYTGVLNKPLVLTIPGLWLNMFLVLNMSGFWIWLLFWIHASGSEYARVLNMPLDLNKPLVPNISRVWIYLGSEYASSSECTTVLNMPLVLNMPGFWIWLWFWICQDSEYPSGSDYTRVLNMPGLYRLLNMPDYAGICVNMPKSAWITFVLHFSIEILYLLERVVTGFNVYKKLEVGSCFLEEAKYDFCCSGWKFMIFCFFCFRLNIFASTISNLLLPSWYTIVSKQR